MTYLGTDVFKTRRWSNLLQIFSLRYIEFYLNKNHSKCIYLYFEFV